MYKLIVEDTMAEPELKSIGQIETTEIGAPREADVLFSKICRSLGALVSDQEFERDDDFLNQINGGPEVTFSRHWSSPQLIPGTKKPELKVEEINDPWVLGRWSVELSAQPLEDSTPTIDSYTVSESGTHLSVERQAVNRSKSGYYEGYIEGGVVYDVALAVADMKRLRTLSSALEAALQEQEPAE